MLSGLGFKFFRSNHLIKKFSDKASIFKNKIELKRKRVHMEIKCRENPVVMKLDSPEFQSIFSQEVIDLKKVFDKYQYEIRIAGGAVRDLLMGQQPTDLDFATIATPQQMKEMFTTENIRMINMNGEKHGTITPRINDKENFEVTTLRIDIVTDGRRAEVQFTTDWKLDANRRDLTINSMFLGFDGTLYDYFFGYDDLKKRRVVFVGDADTRIKEDYLRIMRYFRFYGRIAEESNKHDEETLKAISTNVEGLQIVSGERIWVELKKTLQGNFAGDLLKTILSVGIGNYIGLPGISKSSLEELDSMLKRAQHLKPHPMSYMAALLKDIDEVTVLHNRLKFSKFERDMLYFLVENRGENTGSTPLRPYEKLVLNTKFKQNDAIEYVRELLKYKGEEDLLVQFNNWEIPRLPINGKILKENNVPAGKCHGAIIRRLKDIWIENDYKQTTDDLVKLIPNLIDEYKENK